ncbi:MAG: hypothetical protein QF752_08380 [Planctomycetota bacterium]|jgi:hypothetical protein|nr:hypothetical protein [Planctomycetota bacterium]
MKTKVLLVLVLGLGIGFGFAVGLVVLPEKAAADVPDSSLFKPYTPEFRDWVTVTLQSFMSHEYFVVRLNAGKWLIDCSFKRGSGDHYTKGLEVRKDYIRQLCKYWKDRGYDIEFGRDFEWTVNWY